MQQQLYHVRVLERTEKGERSIDVGPKMIKDAAQMFRDAIEKQIRSGKEKVWSDPIIYAVYD